MDLVLNYIYPGWVGHSSTSVDQSPESLEWLYDMIEHNPDVIFFYTVHTTDISSERV